MGGVKGEEASALSGHGQETRDEQDAAAGQEGLSKQAVRGRVSSNDESEKLR